MAMQGLVNGECGGLNPLMKLTEQFQAGTFDKSNVEQHQNSQSGLHYHGGRQAENVVQQTFNMQCLLDEMQDLQRPSGMAELNYMSAANDWQKEYASQDRITDDSTRMKLPKVSNVQLRPANMYEKFMNPSMAYRIPPTMTNRSNWAHEFIDKNLESIEDGHRQTGKEIIESFEQTEINDEQHSNASKIVRTIKSGDQIVHFPNYKSNDIASDWIEEYKKNEASGQMEDEVLQVVPETTESDFEYWEKLQKDWNELFSQEQFLNQEDSTVHSTSRNKKYSFEENNPFAGFKNAFEEGLKKLNEGDLISAILLFEEAVTSNPDHAEAWQYLGTSQAENEQEMLAIKALDRCLELQADNLEARMALAVSYTNESMYFQACETLKLWMENNPRYTHLVTGQSTTPVETNSQTYTSSLVSSVSLKQVESMFLSAARIAPQGAIDADVQIGLGVLFNISHEYEKAIDCFKSGLQAQPDSAYLWNKLGATLANSGRSAEATEAYRNALQLRPGFIRCRYNLGIGCINMKIYGNAVEHFLTALNMQRQGEDRSRAASTMSENIWDTLRMTVSLLGRTDLLRVVEKRDLQRLNQEFNGA